MASVPTESTSEVLAQFPEFEDQLHKNSEKHSPDPYGQIQDNSRDIKSTSHPEDALCASCSVFYRKCSLLSYYKYIIVETSTVGATLSNEKCPSCRLIAHCIKSLPRAQSIPLELEMSLLSTPEIFVARTGCQGECTEAVSPRRVEIRLHMKKSTNEVGINIDDCDVIGLLLPAATDGFSDSIGLAGHEELFNTLEYQGSVYARSIAYTVDVELLRTWIEFCTTSHSSCRITKTPNDANIGLRLIDVTERRLIDTTLGEDYIALSYVWGPDNDKVLMKDTLDHLQKKGSLTTSTVPRLIADVMDFVAEIGERYLWIDTACIIQDDPLDKQRQLPNMSSIYRRAKFTIVAVVEGANDPLPRWNDGHDKIPLPVELIRGIAYTIGERPLLAALTRTTWNRRGWTLQEALLARRLLISTYDLIYWSCREESWCEDQYTEFRNVKNEPAPQSSLFAVNFRQSSCDGKQSAIRRLSAMDLYAYHAQAYSRRSFSNYSDIIWAYLGILTAMKEHFPNGYTWALPYDQMSAALLWFASCERTRCIEHQYGLSDKSRLPIPSWCWIGKGHEIWFLDGIDKTKSLVTWHKPVECRSSDADSIDDDQELMHLSQTSVLSDTKSTTEIDMFSYAYLHFTAQATMLFIELKYDPSNLKVLTEYLENEQTESECHEHVDAHISLPSKRTIGRISLPVYMFRNNTQRFGEFVLMSEYTGEIDSDVLNNDTRPVRGRKSEKGSSHDRGELDAECLHLEEKQASKIENGEDQNQNLHNAKKKVIPEGHMEGCEHQPALNLMLIEWDETQNIKNFARRVGIARIDPSVWEEVVTTEKTIILG